MQNLVSTAYAGVITEAPRINEVLLGGLLFLLKIVGVLFVIAFVFSGVLYFMAGGDTRMVDKAKKSMTYSIVGLIIILGAMLIIRWVAGFFA